MRKVVRRLVVALIFVLLTVGGWLLGRELYLQRRTDLRKEVLKVLPGVSQRIQNFHRSRVVNGKTVWEVSAREAQYYEQEQTVVVSGPAVSFYTSDGREVVLRGEEGKVYLGGKDLEGLELRGGVEVKFGKYGLRTEDVRYERFSDTILVPGTVQISGEEFDIRGERMTIYLSAQRLLVDGGVQTTLRPGA